jgi:hypothetical protein
VSTALSYTFTMTGSRSLTAGFALMPALNFAPAGGSLSFTWPAAADGWVLEESPDMSPGSWVNSARPVSIVSGQNRVTVDPASGRMFFRLIHP